MQKRIMVISIFRKTLLGHRPIQRRFILNWVRVKIHIQIDLVQTNSITTYMYIVEFHLNI